MLVALVALSLILLTAYFGESPNGRLHDVQRGFLTVVSPIQEGANAALKPVRNLFGWFGNALHAKHQLAEVRKQNNRCARSCSRVSTTNAAISSCCGSTSSTAACTSPTTAR